MANVTKNICETAVFNFDGSVDKIFKGEDYFEAQLYVAKKIFENNAILLDNFSPMQLLHNKIRGVWVVTKDDFFMSDDEYDDRDMNSDDLLKMIDEHSKDTDNENVFYIDGNMKHHYFAYDVANIVYQLQNNETPTPDDDMKEFVDRRKTHKLAPLSDIIDYYAQRDLEFETVKNVFADRAKLAQSKIYA